MINFWDESIKNRMAATAIDIGVVFPSLEKFFEGTFFGGGGDLIFF